MLSLQRLRRAQKPMPCLSGEMRTDGARNVCMVRIHPAALLMCKKLTVNEPLVEGRKGECFQDHRGGRFTGVAVPDRDWTGLVGYVR